MAFLNRDHNTPLPHQAYPELSQTKAELDELNKLYTLYSKVTDTIAKWHECPWQEIINEMANMTETIENFGKEQTKLPLEARKF